jgi:Xaa-Pro aminopeptidase
MAIDPERHSRILSMLHEQKLDALVCSAPTQVLLLTGYRPVMGNSIAIFTADGDVHLLVPEDEHEIVATSSSALLTGFSPVSLDELRTPSEAIRKPFVSLCTKLSFAQTKEGMVLEHNLIRPGIHARQVDGTARSDLEKYSYGKQFTHALGHGAGFAANANGRPRIHPASPDVLEAGMTFNAEPAIYIEGYGGMRHCDVVAVTSSGADVLTQFQTREFQPMHSQGAA